MPDAGVSPFAGLTGCLPALLPMPILLRLFFVFQNTIEFRGVPFMWLHDNLDQGSVVHSAAPNGCVDVRALVDLECVMLLKSAGENDGLHVSRYVTVVLFTWPRAQSLLTRPRTSLHSTAMLLARSGPESSRGIGESHAACHIYCHATLLIEIGETGFSLNPNFDPALGNFSPESAAPGLQSMLFQARCDTADARPRRSLIVRLFDALPRDIPLFDRRQLRNGLVSEDTITRLQSLR